MDSRRPSSNWTCGAGDTHGHAASPGPRHIAVVPLLLERELNTTTSRVQGILVGFALLERLPRQTLPSPLADRRALHAHQRLRTKLALQSAEPWAVGPDGRWVRLPLRLPEIDHKELELLAAAAVALGASLESHSWLAWAISALLPRGERPTAVIGRFARLLTLLELDWPPDVELLHDRVDTSFPTLSADEIRACQETAHGLYETWERSTG